MFRQCQICDGHVYFARLSRKIPDSMDWDPILVMDRTLKVRSQILALGADSLPPGSETTNS